MRGHLHKVPRSVVIASFLRWMRIRHREFSVMSQNMIIAVAVETAVQDIPHLALPTCSLKMITAAIGCYDSLSWKVLFTFCFVACNTVATLGDSGKTAPECQCEC